MFYFNQNCQWDAYLLYLPAYWIEHLTLVLKYIYIILSELHHKLEDVIRIASLLISVGYDSDKSIKQNDLFKIALNRNLTNSFVNTSHNYFWMLYVRTDLFSQDQTSPVYLWYWDPVAQKLLHNCFRMPCNRTDILRSTSLPL